MFDLNADPNKDPAKAPFVLPVESGDASFFGWMD
jgi:hypothetical protein